MRAAPTISSLRVRTVCGGANNQLADADARDARHRRGVLYAPDYIANAGGIVNIATEILGIADRKAFVSDGLAALQRMMAEVFARAAAEGVGPHRIADEMARARIEAPQRAACLCRN